MGGPPEMLVRGPRVYPAKMAVLREVPTKCVEAQLQAYLARITDKPCTRQTRPTAPSQACTPAPLPNAFNDVGAYRNPFPIRSGPNRLSGRRHHVYSPTTTYKPTTTDRQIASDVGATRIGLRATAHAVTPVATIPARPTATATSTVASGRRFSCSPETVVCGRQGRSFQSRTAQAPIVTPCGRSVNNVPSSIAPRPADGAASREASRPSGRHSMRVRVGRRPQPRSEATA